MSRVKIPRVLLSLWAEPGQLNLLGHVLLLQGQRDVEAQAVCLSGKVCFTNQS